MENNNITYVEFYNEETDVTVKLPVHGIKNDFLNVNERVGAYDELKKYLKDDAISGFVILYAYKKETDKENEICH